jgi:hypothetical protein
MKAEPDISHLATPRRNRMEQQIVVFKLAGKHFSFWRQRIVKRGIITLVISELPEGVPLWLTNGLQQLRQHKLVVITKSTSAGLFDMVTSMLVNGAVSGW